jgi:hypothetical protein
MKNIFAFTVLMFSSVSFAATFEVSGTIDSGEWKHFGSFDAASLAASLTMDADVDLYVKQGAQPTSYDYDCRPYKSDSNSENCNFLQAGEYFVSINGYANSASYELTVQYTVQHEEDFTCSMADQECPEGFMCEWGCPTEEPCGINPPGQCVPELDLTCSMADQECPEGYLCEWGCPTEEPCGINPPGQCFRQCGARLGDTCAENEFCNIPAEGICGWADVSGTCHARPEACTYVYMPVCGCDSEIYSNACEASAAGFAIAPESHCESQSLVLMDDSDGCEQELDSNGKCPAKVGCATAGSATGMAGLLFLALLGLVLKRSR